MAKGSRGGKRTSLGKGQGLNPNDIVGTTSLISEREGHRQEVDEVLTVGKDMFDEYGIEIDFEVATLKGNGRKALGYYDGDNIAINKAHFDSKNMAAVMDTCTDRGMFHPSRGNKTGLQSVAAHEFGHALTDKIVNSRKISEKQIISRAAKQTGHGQDHKAFASKISGYAKESNRECIAEAVADVYCNGSKAKKESRAIVNILKGK